VTFINGRLSVEMPPPARQNPVVKQSILAVLLAAIFLGGSAGRLAAQGTAFFYQGRLSDTGTLANTNYDFRFAIYNVETNGTPASILITNSAVPVSNGLFTVTLDFGSGVFTGSDAWLDIAVRAAGTTNFTPLLPRQPILPVPYAIFAGSASNLVGGLSTTQLVGTLPASAFAGYTNTVSLTNANNQFKGTFAGAFNGVFAGNGLALTNFDGAHVTTGTVADARLSANVALLNTNQTFTGSNIFTGNNTFNGVNTFSNFNNSFSGSFYGNGLVGWNAFSSSLTAVRDHGYMLTGPQLITVTLPSSPLTNGDIVRVSGAGAGGWLVQVNSGQSILGTFASYKNCGYPAVVSPVSSSSFNGVAVSADGNRMYAVGDNITGYYVSSDSGKSWTQISIPAGFLHSIACSANGKIVYAEPTSGYLRMSTNGGTIWSTNTTSATGNAISCTADGSQVFTGNIACSGNGTNLAKWTSSSILISTNAGSSWPISITPPASNLSCLAASSDCTRLVAGATNGLLYASANRGAAWTTLTATNQYWSGAWMSADGTKFAASASKNGSIYGDVFYFSTSPQPNTTTTSTLCGSQGSAVELQYIGNNQFIPVSSSGLLWAN
jgi:hypothetical protein